MDKEQLQKIYKDRPEILTEDERLEGLLLTAEFSGKERKDAKKWLKKIMQDAKIIENDNKTVENQ